MATNNKTLLWVGIGSAVLIGGGVGWWLYNKNKQKKEEAKKKAEEEAKKKEEEERANKPPVQPSYQPTYQPTYQPEPTLPSTGFTKAQGDAFRVWHNKNYPNWRWKGDILSPSGEPDNAFVRKAYSETKTEYDKYLADLNKPKPDPKATKYGYKIGESVIAKAIATMYTSDTKVKRYVAGGTNNKGDIQAGYYAGVVQSVNEARNSVKLRNYTYPAKIDTGEIDDKDTFKSSDDTPIYKVFNEFWVEGDLLEKR